MKRKFSLSFLFSFSSFATFFVFILVLSFFPTQRVFADYEGCTIGYSNCYATDITKMCETTSEHYPCSCYGRECREASSGWCKDTPTRPYYCWTWYCPCTCYKECDGVTCYAGGGGGDGSLNNDYMHGMIWEDKNKNGAYDLDEEFKGKSSLSCSSYPHTGFVVNIDGKNRARDWLCWGGQENIPINRQAYWWSGSKAIGWGGDAQIPNGSVSAYLSGLPSGYTCKNWKVYNCPSDVCDAVPSYTGTGCGALFFKNHQARLNWEIGPAGCSSNNDCNDNLFCTDDICNTSTGVCSHPAKSCDDSNSCTTDSCNETTDSCVHTNNPVNGGWTDWGTCVSCSQSRTCTNPAPSCGGTQCSGPSTQSCGLVNGKLGAWGTCTGGTHASACVDFLCGGNCSTACSNAGGTYNYSTNVCTRNCLRIDGKIWSDDDKNGYSTSDHFKGKNDLTCTNKFYGGFNLAITSEPSANQIANWWCHDSGYGAYYNTPVPNTIEPGSTRKFTLSSLPANYSCDSWEFIYKKDETQTSLSGPGCSTSNLTMPPYAEWVNINWELSCAVIQGDTSPWTECFGGKQTRTCTGATCCGTNCGNCNGAPLERDCLSIEGYIWSDDNNDNSKQNSENFKSSALSGCSTSKIFNSFNMSITSEVGNQISSWWCHGTNGAYYTTPNSAATKSIEPESTKTISLTTIPSGYKYKGWEFRYSKDGEQTSQTGSGSVASNLLMPPYASWVNVHWELAQKKYTLKLKVKEIPPEITNTLGLCSSPSFSSFENMSGANVTIKDSSGSSTLCQGISDSNGEFSCPIWTQQGTINIYVSKTVGGDTPETYTMKCPAVGSYTYTPFPTPLDGQTINLNIGLQTIYKKGWVSAIDADIFANNLNVVVPDGPTNNSSPGQIYPRFAKTLINSSSNNNNTLGFIFSHSDNKSNPDVDRPCPNKKGFETNTGCGTEYGGYAYDLMDSNQDHKSIWLENFSFSPPSSAKEISSLPTTFNSGSIYSISSSAFNNRLKSGSFSYSISGDGGNGMSVLYIDGNADILNPITTSSSGRLLLVVDGSLTVGSSVGSSISSFDLSLDPNIMAGVISSGQVTIASIGGTISDSHFDKPIMLTAPFVSKTGISFGRDLYHDNNAKLPAEAVKSFGKYLYYISNLEKTKSADYLYYTGVSTYDISWEYIY